MLISYLLFFFVTDRPSSSCPNLCTHSTVYTSDCRVVSSLASSMIMICYHFCFDSVVVSAKCDGFAPRPGRSLLRITSSRVLAAHSALTSRLGINLVEGKAARRRLAAALICLRSFSENRDRRFFFGGNFPWPQQVESCRKEKLCRM